jgi:DNA-binding MarR family transcriptional regulator
MTNQLNTTLLQWMQVVMRHSMRNLILFTKDRNSSMAMINALFRVHYKGKCGVSDLGDHLGVSNAAASQMLEKMVQQGLVARIEDPQDRRNKLISLTPEGNVLVRESMEARQGWLTELVDLLSPAEQEQIQTSLQLLIDKTATLDQKNI